MKWTLSKYITEYKMSDGTIGLFNSVFLTKRFIDSDSWSRIKQAIDYSDLPAKQIENLKNGKMIVEEGEDEKRLNELKAMPAMSPSNEVMYLVVTNTCNMRCKYCVVDKECAQSETGSFMTKETADRAIELFLTNTTTERPSILLWGGEPLSNWPVFKYAVERARELEKRFSKKLNISTVTNGTLLTRKIAGFLNEFRVGCSISIDGMKEQHDGMRIYADGSGTFRDIRDNVKLLKEAGVKFGIALTIGSHNVDVLPAVAPGLCRELEIKRMGCSLLLNVDPANPAYTDNERVAKQLIDLFKRLCEDGIFEETMTRKVKSFAFHNEHLHNCAAGGRQIAVMPNGEIGICHYAGTESRWIIGNVEDPPEDVFRNEVRVEWARRSPINMPECYECPGLVLCGGGCPYEAFQVRGDLWALDERFCTHCKEAIKWMMEELHEAWGSAEAETSPLWIGMMEVVAHRRFIDMFMPALRGIPGATVTNKELQRGSDAFRRSNGVHSAKATEEWMSRHGITPEFYQEFLESSILLNSYEYHLGNYSQ